MRQHDMGDVGDVDRLRAAVEHATATVTSDDHAITVTVAPGNAVTELELSGRATRMDAAALGPAIVATIARAVEQVSSSLATEIERFAPGRGSAATRLGGPLPDPPPAPPEQGEPVDDLAAEFLSGPPPDFGMAAPRAEASAGTEATGTAAGGAGPSGDARHSATGPPEDLLSGVDTTMLGRLRAQSEATLAGYAEVRRELTDRPTVTRSSDGTVTVTVLPGGTIRSIDIDEAALRHGPGNVGSLVLSTIHRASADSAMRLAERVQELAGPSLSLRSLVESYIPENMRPERGPDDPFGRH